MLKRLIDFVVSGKAAPPFTLTLQDVALCQLWCDGQQRQGAGNAAAGSVQNRIDAWIETPDVPELNTAGRRHQFLLRQLLDRLVKGTASGLSADEVAFLCTAWNVVERSKPHDGQSRFAELIGPHLQSLREQQKQFSPSNDAYQLERSIQYASAADILAAEVSSIRILAGIELPCRGPVFRAGNNLRILGDIPDNCTVVVENEGYCSVEGYVMGRLLAKRYCEIRHNISGVAIVLRGHIRARGIINNAHVISKMGSVVCMNAQGPKLVFAGQAIEIRESTMMGKFITRDLRVGNEVRGSHIEVAGTAQATHFRNLGMSGVSIVLRRELTCEDYGEVTGDDLKQLLSRAYSLRRNSHNFRNMEAAARREADHTAQSVLMYIFGGGEVQKRLQGFLRAQRRHTVVTNVVDNLQNILEQAQDGFVDAASLEENRPAPAQDSTEDMADEQDLIGARAAAEKLERSLRMQNLNRTQRTMILDEVREKLVAMRTLQRETAEKMKEEERSIQHLEQYEKVLASSGEGATKLDALMNILPAMKKQPEDSSVGSRLRSNFVVRALRSIERARRHADEFGDKGAKYLEDFRAVSERLGKDYQIRVLENPEDEETTARVTGVFDGGARIFMDVFVENLAEAPRDTVLTTGEDHGVRTFVRANAGGRFHSSEHD